LRKNSFHKCSVLVCNTGIFNHVNSRKLCRPAGRLRRYYHLFFMDDTDSIHCKRGLKSGILQVDSQGKLSILNDRIELMNANSSFIFKNGQLELRTNEWFQFQKINSRSCAIL